MRLKSQKQLYFKIQSAYTSQEEELVLMSLRLESLPGYEGILTKVLEDLNPSKGDAGGRDGMTAEQVLRALIVKMRKGHYSELKHLALSEGIENGKEIRTDAFNTQVNIHYPTDWSLMHDSIRVLSRTLCRERYKSSISPNSEGRESSIEGKDSFNL